MRPYIRKTGVESPLLDIDSKGFVRVAVNKVNVKDHDGDVIVPEAYTKTLKESKELIYHLTDHSWQFVNSLIARPKDIYLKDDFLVFDSEIDLKTNPHGAYMHARYQSGDVQQHSIGSYFIKASKKDDYQEVTELQLLEGSAVLWGANPHTPTLEVKAMTVDQRDEALKSILKQIEEHYNSFKRYLKTGITAEDTLFMGRHLSQLHTELESIKATKPPHSTLPEKMSSEEIKSIINSNFILK
ncbi:MAG: HK97 family phage prohead protease [Cytophagales bacterium]|nr:HK97 family phage prohead protease [Cytophagales bacterium]